MSSTISAVDLFCGGGGFTHGLIAAGIAVEAGIDFDQNSAYAYTANNSGAQFLRWDLSETSSEAIGNLFAPNKVRLLVGCAPCQPFSIMTPISAKAKHKSKDLMGHYCRFIQDIRPELVAMENVPPASSSDFLHGLVDMLLSFGYNVDFAIVDAAEYGVPQFRRRLILLGSRLGVLRIQGGFYRCERTMFHRLWRTVRSAIGHLPRLEAGRVSSEDRLHYAPTYSDIVMRRIQATPHDGGSRFGWPENLKPKRHTGKKFHEETHQGVYGRLRFDLPSPTIATRIHPCNGRYTHPDQDRGISLREAAILQSFPLSYQFWPADKPINKTAISRMIGNAVPPLLSEALGLAMRSHVEASKA